MAKEFVDRILNKLFGDREETSPEEMLPIKEKLKRSDKFLYKFQEWKDSGRSKAVFTRLSNLHKDVLNGQRTDLLHVHKTPQANGFFFDDRTGVAAEEFSFILDYFKDRALEEGYSIYSSENRYQEKSDSVQEMERHYLKPYLDPSLELPIDQRYGNILLEYVAYNKKPAYLKVMVSCYSDRNYTKALDFSGLVQKFFS
jgi:hypothetical protein